MLKLTIGMATYQNSNGVITTIQNIRLNNLKLLNRLHFVIIDNCPEPYIEDTSRGSNHSTELINFITWLGDGHTYIPLDSPRGTAPPRNKVFEVSKDEFTMCVDDHVYFPEGVIQKVFDYLDAHPDSNDLLSGPILKDDLSVMATRFDEEWRHEMEGIWGYEAKEADPVYGPSEIPAMGLGMFVCRTEAWRKVGGFHPLFRGFGGEEFYIHRRFRQHGYKCLNIPEWKWWHNFHQATGHKYPADVWNKVRNYVIGHAHTGRPFDKIQEHFVDTGRIPKHEYLQLLATPLNPPEYPSGKSGHITREFVEQNIGNPNAERPAEYVPVVEVDGQKIPVNKIKTLLDTQDLTLQANPQGGFRLRIKKNLKGVTPQSPPIAVEQKPAAKPPGLFQSIWNAATAAKDFISDGLTLVPKEVYEHRLSVCEVCPSRVNTRCNECGCNLPIKAAGRAWDCPLGKWTQVNSDKPVVEHFLGG